MPPVSATPDTPVPPARATLARFLPYLWPKDNTALRLRVVASFALVIASILVTTLVMPQAFGRAVDRLVAGKKRASRSRSR